MAAVFRLSPSRISANEVGDEDQEEDGDGFELEIQDASTARSRRLGVKKKKSEKTSDPAQILSYRLPIHG